MYYFIVNSTQIGNLTLLQCKLFFKLTQKLLLGFIELFTVAFCRETKVNLEQNLKSSEKYSDLQHFPLNLTSKDENTPMLLSFRFCKILPKVFQSAKGRALIGRSSSQSRDRSGVRK